MDFIFIILSAVLSLSSAAEVFPLRGSFCLGEPAEWICTANNSLRWRNQPIGSAVPRITLYDVTDSYTQPERDLGSVGPIRVSVTSLRGTEYLSRARVDMNSSLNGTRLECAGDGESFGLVNATVYLSVTEPVVISYLIIQFMSRNTIILEWGGAQCVSYYIIEANGFPVGTTTQTSYIYQRNTNGDTLTFTVYGVDFIGNNFTNITKTIAGPIYNTNHILADNDDTLYIVIERDDTDRLPIRDCNLTFNSESRNCSGNRVFRFDVTPGEYSYSVVMSNDVGSSVYGTTVTVDPSPSVSSSIVCPSTTDLSTSPSCTPAPSCSPCPPRPCKLPLWAIIVMIVLGALLGSAVVFYIWKLWWRHRCCCRKCFCEDEDCCCQGCWDSPFWTYFFCECFQKDRNNKRVATATANLRTTSPDEKDMMSSIEKDTSKM